MSIIYTPNFSRSEIVEFLESEYEKGSGVPIHLFSVVNAHMDSYNRSLGVTDDKGTIFLEDEFTFASYGASDTLPLLKTFRRCGVHFTFD